MPPVPWRYVRSWSCIACGICCKGFGVVLSFPEWVNVVRAYGVGATQPGLNGFYLKKRDNGSCVFLYNLFGRWVCGLQSMKPLACKIWPFKVLDTPKFGRPNEACYNYVGRKLFIYVDPVCIGTQWGEPTREFASRTLSEFVEIALGLRRKQLYSTADLNEPSSGLRMKRDNNRPLV